MRDIYLATLVLGAVVLAAQTVFGLLGASHVLPDSVETGPGEGLDLLSVRTVSAGAALFGAVGLWLGASGVPQFVAAPAAVAAGIAAAAATAFVTRQMLRLESDGTLKVENAVGQSATVYLPIPARGDGQGVVQFELQGRTIELRAISSEDATIPTGTSVVVVSVLEGDTVEVMPTPLIEGIDE